MELSVIAPILTGVVAIIGAVVAKVLDSRSKKLSFELSSEIELRKMLLSRVDTLDLQLAMALKKVQDMEKKLHEKEVALLELSWKYESLKEAHSYLLDRYKLLAAGNQQLMDEVLQYYVEHHRRTSPPPRPYYPKEDEVE